jgi:hypothetical protein
MLIENTDEKSSGHKANRDLRIPSLRKTIQKTQISMAVHNYK